MGGQGRKAIIPLFLPKRYRKRCGLPKPLPLGEVSPKVTERASPFSKNRCAAMGRLFVRAMLSQRLGFAVSILALSVSSQAPRQGRVAAPSVCFAAARILLAAAPTAPPCFRHWRRSSPLPQRGSPWHVGQLSSGRAKRNVSEAAVLRCLGQRQLDKERCPEAAVPVSKARPFASCRASVVQWKVIRPAKASPSGGGVAVGDGEGSVNLWKMHDRKEKNL